MKHFVLHSRYYYSLLSDAEKTVYRKIYDCWVTGSTIARIEIKGKDFILPSGRKLHELVTYILDDNPHLFHLETSSFQYRRRGESVTISAENVYSAEQYAEICERLIDRVDTIVKQVNRCQSDYEKLRFLHDHLAENITYNVESSDKRLRRESHTIVGALLNSACVCDGFARAYRLLCDQIGFPCLVISGTGLRGAIEEPHAWNLVKLEKNFYHVDVTWDHSLMEVDIPVTDYYFLRNDERFLKDHLWDHMAYPVIEEDYPRREPLLKDDTAIEQYVRDQMLEGKTEILFRVSEKWKGAGYLTRIMEEIQRKDPDLFAETECQCNLYETIQYGMVYLRRKERIPLWKSV